MNGHDIRQEVYGKAAGLLGLYFSLTERAFPVNMKLLASIAGIKVAEKYMPDDRSGQLVVREDGLYAYTNIFDSPARQNFTIAHEIAHTFFPNYRQVEYRSSLLSDLVEGAATDEEKLCDEVASELLIPADEFRRKLAEFGEELASLVPLAKYFGASYEAIAMKLSQHGKRKAVILTVSDYGSKQGLRVTKVFPFAEWELFIPRNVRIPPHTPISSSLLTNGPLKEEMDVQIGPVKGTFKVETLPGKFKRKGKLYSSGYLMLSI